MVIFYRHSLQNMLAGMMEMGRCTWTDMPSCGNSLAWAQRRGGQWTGVGKSWAGEGWDDSRGCFYIL